MVDPSAFQAPYQQVADRLIDQIKTGQLQPESRLPSVKQLASMFKVSPGTAYKGLRVVVDRGFARINEGRGTWVMPADQLPPLD